MSEPLYEVVWPLGRSTWNTRGVNARVGDLNGKVIGELWDYLFRGEEIFPLIRETMTKMFPGIRFITYENLGDIQGANQKVVLERLPAALAGHDVDAVITGIGA